MHDTTFALPKTAASPQIELIDNGRGFRVVCTYDGSILVHETGQTVYLMGQPIKFPEPFVRVWVTRAEPANLCATLLSHLQRVPFSTMDEYAFPYYSGEPAYSLVVRSDKTAVQRTTNGRMREAHPHLNTVHNALDRLIHPLQNQPPTGAYPNHNVQEHCAALQPHLQLPPLHTLYLLKHTPTLLPLHVLDKG